MDTVRIDSAPPTPVRGPLPAISLRHRYDTDPDAGWIIVAHVLAPLAGMLSGWMALTIAGRRSEFVRQHARQAINIQFNAIGAMIISMAVTNATNPPTDVSAVALWTSATEITADSAMAASIWVMGVMAAPATVDFMARLRSESPNRSNRSA